MIDRLSTVFYCVFLWCTCCTTSIAGNTTGFSLHYVFAVHLSHRMMARSDLGGTHGKKGGWIKKKKSWSLPITARVGACSYYRATLRSLRASHAHIATAAAENQADGRSEVFPISAREKPQAGAHTGRKAFKIWHGVDCKDSTDSG